MYLRVCDSEVIVFFRSFKKAINDVILSRRAIRNMNTLYPDATPEELAAADNVCIICREEMVTGKQSTCFDA
jgi:E3 ubiquitin-protein ligase synoviolin